MFHNRSKVFFILSLVFVLLVGAVLFTGAYEEEDTYYSLSSKPAVQYLFGTPANSSPTGSASSSIDATKDLVLAEGFGTSRYEFVEFDFLQTDVQHREALNVFISAHKQSYRTVVATVGTNSPFPAGGEEPEEAVSLGWHHVCVVCYQDYTITDGDVSYYMHSKVYVDGVPTQADFTDISLNDEDDEHCSNNRLFTIDPGFLPDVVFDCAPYKQQFTTGAEMGTDCKGVIYKNFSVGYGNAPSKTVSRISYDLNGGSFAEDFEVIPQTRNGKTTYPEAAFYTPDVMNYYTVETLSLDVVSTPDPRDYSLPADPVRSGYRFTGWYADDELRDEVTAETLDDFLSSGTDVTLYAGWEESPYTLTLSVDGVETPADGSTLPVGTVWISPDGEVVAGGTVLSLSDDVTYYALKTTLLNGASIRTNTPTGLRFSMTVDEDLIGVLNDNAVDFTVGVLIYPTDQLVGELTRGTVGAIDRYSDLDGVDASAGVFTMNAAITNIRAMNYARAFSARSYIRIGETVVYTANVVSRSVYQVAKAAYEDDPAGYTDAQRTVIRSFIDAIVEITSISVGSVTQYSGTNYVPTRAVTYDGSTITMSEGDSVKAVILGGNIYTAGWTVTDGTLTAAYVKP